MGTVALHLSERESDDLVRQQADRFLQVPGLSAVMDAVPSPLLIVNGHRQVVFANRSVCSVLKVPSSHRLLGRRPGELFDCEHAAESEHGCGTGEACSACGAAKAIQASESGAAAVLECRLHQRSASRAMDLRVSTTPIELDGKQFSVVSLSDISHENRRRALERIFFHDLLNTLGALMGYVQLLEGAPAAETDELTDSILRLSDTLAEEIRAQRDLAAAESNDLAVRLEEMNSREMMEQIAVNYRNHPVARGRTIVLDPQAISANFRSDRRLLLRILSNMLKNAVEATPPGGEVGISCHRAGDRLVLAVTNPGHIPVEVQHQIFHRAFSTKGTGRGLGTYSMKLLGEKYLAGSVGFQSTPETGTRFSISLPAGK